MLSSATSEDWRLFFVNARSLISVNHIILISSLGSVPGEQPTLNNSSLCRSLSSNHLEAGIRNAYTESEPMSHHSQATPPDHTSPETNLKSLKILISNFQSLLTDFVIEELAWTTHLIYLDETLTLARQFLRRKKKKHLLLSRYNISRLDVKKSNHNKHLAQTTLLPMWGTIYYSKSVWDMWLANRLELVALCFPVMIGQCPWWEYWHDSNTNKSVKSPVCTDGIHFVTTAC